MMKKMRCLTAMLALGLCFGCGTSAFAQETKETVTEVPKDTSITVQGKYTGDGKLVDTYNVDIEWGAMTFTYTANGNRRWDAENHTYSVTSSDGWTAEGDTVKVINHSNLPVDVVFNFAKNENVNGTYTGTMSVASKQLAAGVENKPDDADFVESKLTLDGTLNAHQTETAVLGTITVSLRTVIDSITD